MPKTSLPKQALPTQGDSVRLYIPELSPMPIVTFVTYRRGNFRKTVHVACMTGPSDRHGSIQVIWKRKTGWFCWLLGKRYAPVELERI